MASTSGSAEQIQAEIEATRAQLAATLDELVDRVSPKRVVSREVGHVRALLLDTFTKPADDDLFTGLAQAGDDVEIPYDRPREIRWERVAPVAGGAVLLVGLWVWRRRA